MYLYDYQRATINRIRRGGNYLLSGPGRIGITTILINYALLYAGENNGSTIGFFTPSRQLIDNCERMCIDYLYAARTTNVSIFDHTLAISSPPAGNKISLNNGSTIFFLTPNNDKNIEYNHDLTIVDNAETLSEEDMYSFTATPLFGFMNNIKFTHPLYHLYIDSFRGLNNYQHIGLPIQLLRTH